MLPYIYDNCYNILLYRIHEKYGSKHMLYGYGILLIIMTIYKIVV